MILDSLRRAPDVEAPNLVAVDSADRLVLDSAADALAAAAPGTVTVLGDHYGALTLGALALHGCRDVRVHTDRLTSEQALARNAEEAGPVGSFTVHEDPAAALTGARVVLLALPRALAALDELAEEVARHADPAVVVVAGGRVKHMTPAMNEVLGRHFADVRASLGRQKARVLHAAGPRPGATGHPRSERHDDLGLTVVAHGAAFAGTKVDLGTRFLLSFLPTAAPLARDVVDLGCGTGVLACVAARDRPGARVVAVDESVAAVLSARATAAANGVAVEVVRDRGLSTRAAASADLVLLNPPFHTGATVHERLAEPLFAEAARVLRPGGELWVVHNSALAYRPALRAVVGETRQVGRNRTFTVTASVRD